MRLYPVYALVILLVGSLLYVGAFPPKIWYVLGYYVTPNDLKLAEYLVEQSMPASDCHRLLHFAPMAPPVGEKRLDCIVRYAELTNDPAVCERLMPSSYGWNCLGVAREKGDACDINYARDVTWRESEESAPSVATLAECRDTQGMSKKGQQCCHVLRITSESGFDDCSSFELGSDISELCYGQLAVKLSRIEECEKILDANRREICQIMVRYR